MTTTADPGGPFTLSHLDVLESEAVHVFREVAGEFERPVILFSGGKDSIVMLHLALKAFAPAPLPFSLLHVDTGHNFPEVIAYRDEVAARHSLRLHVAHVQDYLDDGRLRERTDGTRNPLQTVPLLDAITEHRFDGVFGGGRRDEDKARAKERIVSSPVAATTLIEGVDEETRRSRGPRRHQAKHGGRGATIPARFFLIELAGAVVGGAIGALLCSAV